MTESMTGPTGPLRIGRALARRSPAFGLLLLSALWALDSLHGDLFPQFGADTLPPVGRQALLLSIFTAVAASMTIARRIPWPRGRRTWACAGIGVGLFAGPAALGVYAEGWVPALQRVAIFSLTPVFAVVLEPYLQGSPPAQGRAALAGAVAAVAGMLFIVPLDVPGSLRTVVALCALFVAALAIAATNCLAVRLAGSLAGSAVAPMAAMAGAAAAFCFWSAAAFTPHSAWSWSALRSVFPWLLAVDLPALCLLFWLMPRLSASRMTTRFLFAPLLTILAGFVLERPGLTVRSGLGIALLAAGAGWLLFAPEEGAGVEAFLSLNSPGAGSPRPPPRSG
jgi:drug/metabolite transporter (DMT)-like permease